MSPFFSPIALNPGALVASFAVGGGYRRLHAFTATNTNVSTRYIQVFDSVALPSNGAVPLMSIPLATLTGTLPAFGFGIYGRLFANGIVIANSSTAASLTIGSADTLLDVLVS